MGLDTTPFTAPKVVGQFMKSDAEFKAIMGPFGCTSGDTEFLTPSGWKRIDQYTEDDLVGQWSEDGELTFVEPLRYIKESCDELIWFRNKSMSMQLSPEHRMPLYDWSGAFKVKTAEQVEKRPSRHIIPTTFTPQHCDALVTDDEIRLAVAINADAHIDPSRTNNRVAICVRKDRKKTRLRAMLDRMCIKFYEKSYESRPTEVTFFFDAAYMAKTYVGWHWWLLSQRQLRIVVEEMSHWDGLFEGPDTRFFSANKCDADFMQYAAHAVGGKASIRIQTYSQDNWRDTYTVHIALSGSPKAVATLRVDSCEIDRIPTSDGLKYCFTVPTGFFLARHNGFVFATGNSGKSVGCIMEIMRRCINQRVGKDGLRRSRWCVIRSVRQQLHDTTIKTWLDWIPDGVFGKWSSSKMEYDLSFNDVRASIIFRALDTPADVAKLMSLELTGAFINECQYIPREIVEGIQGRLKRYPSVAMGGSNYWMLIADTNAPAEGTYWEKIFTKQPIDEDDPNSLSECDPYIQKSGLDPDADNLENLHPTYYQDLARGKSKLYVDTVVHAIFPPSQDGKPVYHDTFQRDKHVSKVPLKIDPVLPIIVGQDWGLTPAGLYFQVQRDGTVYVLRETPAFDMGTERYIKTKLRPMHLTTFPTNPIIIIGDPSGVRRADSDESTSFQMCKKMGYTAKPASTNDPDVRIKAFDTLFSEFPRGNPKILIDPGCKSFIMACQSGYRYKKKKHSIAEAFDAKPDKDAPCSHLMEGGQYGALFIIGRRFRNEDYMQNTNYNPLANRTPQYRPADPVGGY